MAGTAAACTDLVTPLADCSTPFTPPNLKGIDSPQNDAGIYTAIPTFRTMANARTTSRMQLSCMAGQARLSATSASTVIPIAPAGREGVSSIASETPIRADSVLSGDILQGFNLSQPAVPASSSTNGIRTPDTTAGDGDIFTRLPPSDTAYRPPAPDPGPAAKGRQ